jgi:hypothetical protein
MEMRISSLKKREKRTKMEKVKKRENEKHSEI